MRGMTAPQPHIAWMAAAVCAVVLALGLATPARAQGQSDEGLARLQQKLRAGDRLTITREDGTRQKGQFVSLRDGGLLLERDAARLEVPFAQVTKVERRRRGPLLGPLIGAAAGAAAAVPLYMLQENEGGATAVVLVPIAVGIGTGLAIDALVDLPRTVYRRPNGARLTLAPVLAPGTTGGIVTVRF